MNIRTNSIRLAIADLRAAVSLNDGTWMRVGLAPASDGGRLLGVYEARRTMLNGTVRVYSLS